MSDFVQYRIAGMSLLDVRKIQAANPNEIIVVETPEVSEGRHNELATLAIVGGLVLLGQAAAYYFGKSTREEIFLDIQEIKPDGSVRTVHMKLYRSGKEPVENQIAKALKSSTT